MGLFRFNFGNNDVVEGASGDDGDAVEVDMTSLKKVTTSNVTVKSGDTLSRIAAKHGTSVEELASLNNIKNINLIRIGQKLKIPGQEEEVPAPQQAVPEEAVAVEAPQPAPEAQLGFGEPTATVSPSELERRARMSPTEGLLLPSNVKAFANDLVANSPLKGLAKTKHGNELLNIKEKQAIMELVRNDPAFAEGKERGAITYDRYDDGYSGVRFKEDVTADTFKPGKSVKTTLGQFVWEREDDGIIRIVDRYNFNDAKELQKENPTIVDKVNNIIEYMSDTEKERGTYGLVRRIASLFGSGEGEGAEVEMLLFEDGSDAVGSIGELEAQRAAAARLHARREERAPRQIDAATDFVPSSAPDVINEDVPN